MLSAPDLDEARRQMDERERRDQEQAQAERYILPVGEASHGLRDVIDANYAEDYRSFAYLER